MEYDKLPKSALGKFHKTMPESKVLTEYKQKILDLGDDELGRFTLSKGEVRPGTLKMRLLRASKALGIEIEAKEVSFSEIVDYLRPKGVEIESTSLKQITLDDVFLRLTGKELRE